VPKPIAIMSGGTRQADADLKQLATDYGMSNLNSARAGERAAPAATPKNIVPFRLNAAPAWQGQFGIGEDGKPRAMCVPTGVSARMKGERIINQTARLSKQGQQLGAGSEIVGSSNLTQADIAAAVKGLK